MDGLSIEPSVVEVLHRFLCYFLISKLETEERKATKEKNGKKSEE